MAVGMPQKLAEIKTLSDTLAELFGYDVTHQLPWFGAEVFGNALGAYLVACVTFVLYAALLYFAWHHLLKRWERLSIEHPGSIWQQGLSLAHQVKPHILPLIAFYFATQPLELQGNRCNG